MKKFNITPIALALALALGFGTDAMAETMTKEAHEAARAKIAAEYQSAATACASLSGNQNDICMAEAKGKEKVASAELEASRVTNVQTMYQVRIAKAEAEYAVAKERCDDLSGDAKGACMKKAEAADAAAKADAAAQMKSTDTSSMKSADKGSTPGEYIDDSAITAKVKAAILGEPTLKVAEVNVETNKGTVQLSGFVSSQDAATKAVEVARGVAGVKSVKNDMRIK